MKNKSIKSKSDAKVEEKPFFLDVLLAKHADMIGYVLTALAFVMAVILFNPDVTVGGDDSTYLEAASFFASGKEFPTWHGPMYPMMLSVVIRGLGFNVILFKFLSVLFFAVSVFFTYKIFQKVANAFSAVVCTSVSAISYMMLLYASSTYSEPFFMMLQSLFFYLFFDLLDRLDGWSKLDRKLCIRKNALWFSVLALVVFLMYQTRSLAIAVVPSVLVLLVCLRQYVSAAAFALSSMAIHILNAIYRSVVWGTDSVSFSNQLEANFLVDPYKPERGYETLSGYVDRFWGNCELYLSKHLMKLFGFMDYHSHFVSSIFTVVIVLVLLGAGVYVFRRNRKLFYIFAYVAIMLGVSFVMLQKFWDQERLVMIYFPMILGVLFYCAHQIIGRKAAVVSPLMGFLVLMLCIIQTMRNGEWDVSNNFSSGSYGSYTDDWRNYMSASKWAGENLPEGSMVVCRKGQMSWIAASATDRVRFHSIYRPYSYQPDSMKFFLVDSLKATHVIMANLRLNPYINDGNTITTVRYSLRALLEKYNYALRLVKKFGDKEPAYLFEIDDLDSRNFDNLRAAVLVDPQMPGPWAQMTMTLVDQNKYDEALAVADEAISNMGSNEGAVAFISFYRGVSLYRKQEIDSAMAAFDRTLAFQPHYKDAVFNKAICLYQRSKYPEALKVLEAILPEEADDRIRAFRADIQRRIR